MKKIVLLLALCGLFQSNSRAAGSIQVDATNLHHCGVYMTIWVYCHCQPKGVGGVSIQPNTINTFTYSNIPWAPGPGGDPGQWLPTVNPCQDWDWVGVTVGATCESSGTSVTCANANLVILGDPNYCNIGPQSDCFEFTADCNCADKDGSSGYSAGAVIYGTFTGASGNGTATLVLHD